MGKKNVYMYLQRIKTHVFSDKLTHELQMLRPGVSTHSQQIPVCDHFGSSERHLEIIECSSELMDGNQVAYVLIGLEI